MDISRPICRYYILNQKTNENFGNTMWVLQGGNVAKCSLMIMDVCIA
jgi:hypothetical protein